MIRDLGHFVPSRPGNLSGPVFAMLFNAVHDRQGGQVFVLQVGAGNGHSSLPLYPRFHDDGWSGLLIEPHPQHFAKLDVLHAASERVAVLNLGISDVAATLALHSLTPAADARSPRRRRGRASLLRDRIAVEGTAPEDVVATEVPFLRMDTVLSELGIDSAPVVVINAGGHEAQVLAGFHLATLDPTLACIHATPDTASDATCHATLADAGLLPFRVPGWLVGLAPERLSVPLEELLTFFQMGLGQPQDSDE